MNHLSFALVFNESVFWFIDLVLDSSSATHNQELMQIHHLPVFFASSSLFQRIIAFMGFLSTFSVRVETYFFNATWLLEVVYAGRL